MKVHHYKLLVLAFFMSSISLAQQKRISGTVADDLGVPLPGVNIVIKNTTNGTQTDFDGNYSIPANRGAILVFSYIGFLTQEIVVADSNTINVALAQDAAQLEEVVVTAFGITRNSKKLGYAVSTVQTDDVLENSEPDLIRSLAGKVPGVNVNLSTGVAGASNQINIRGATTLGGASQPLIIVDGVAYDNSQVTTSRQTTGGGGYESGLSSLDPNNIASITVLKSTAAAALYGSRATGGVIVVTTKTGATKGSTNNKLSVSVSSGTYFENIANLPEYQNTYGNGVNFSYLNANGSWGPRFDSLETIPTWPNILNAFPEIGPTVPYEAQPDNVKNLFRTGTVFDNSINMSYSGEDGNFSVTVSDLNQDGYIPFNTYDRTSVAAGGNFKLLNGIRIGSTFSYSETEQVGGFFGNNQFAGSASSFARTLWLGRAWDTSLPFENPITGASLTPNNGWDHPLWSWKHDQIITDTDRIVANVNLGYDFNDNISVTYRVGFNKYNLKRKQIRDLGSRANNGLGSVTTDDFINEDLESTLLVNFNYDLTDDINLTAILGNNVLQNTTSRVAFQGTNFKSPGIFTIANTINVTKNIGGFILDNDTRSRNIGVFGDVSLSYKNYLFLNATGRNDWSSTLPKNNQSYFYPSASVSLIFTDAFNLDSKVLTFGKLRAGYASVGNDAPAEFLNRTFASGNAFNGIPVINNNLFLGDQEITPEFTDEIEIGADLEFFNQRAIIDFSWYKKTTTDLISPVSVPSSSGFTTFNTNIGEMQNTGVEIGLTLVPIRTENFRWELFTTFTKNENEVTELVDGLERIQLDPNQVAHAIVGQPFGVFYGSRFARDDEGNFLINQSGGGIVQDLENGIVGDPNPDFRMGFINTISYKGLSLRAQVDWKEGGDIQSISINSLLGRGVTRDTEDRERTFIIPGFYGDNQGNPILDANGNKIPNTTQIDTNELYFSPAGGNTFGINTVAEGSVYDGTVYRLRELSLTYDLPKEFLKSTPFGKISLSVLGNNLWYFAPNVPKYTNFDPEVTSFGSSRIQGIENSSAPTSKRYGFRLNLSF
ncbi:SusC/RagA family TonB-linked outer membrane protein [Aquimarina sp. BL5]|uniref:SusC/RagA family TonB-linked outer membrane protein n=1 Tax=Aquimarina sp. BL5 TaxID=1714860 RepID=UPI000E519C2B|nr:SusC/RagA family TonB-linked outer membrane protein [Aquimarina sp. BL5]AXT50711.1 SusC/RagA family TonB-linked outer membrane protein [Aquimarina sp. BL5]RKN05273.1 SusC/RagA family TonB-linked outer membrane protein [Aquimarina sp. BL5]